METKANKGKKLTAHFKGVSYSRYPIKTHLISKNDDIVDVVDTYVRNVLLKGDTVVISERIVAISQGRSYPIENIKPGWWAQRLWKFVHNHPGGVGLRSPWTMQLAIQEAGVPRILLAAGSAILTKPFGLKGVFYHVVGNNINAIDGPAEYSLPPSNTSAKLAPKDPDKVAQQISERLGGCSVVIIDANDYGVNVLGSTMGAHSGEDPRQHNNLIKNLFKDNPMGQTDEQTPIIIVRKSSS